MRKGNHLAKKQHRGSAPIEHQLPVIPPITEHTDLRNTILHLETGRKVMFACGKENGVGSTNPDQVTCKSCKRTKLYKELKETHDAP